MYNSEIFYISLCFLLIIWGLLEILQSKLKQKVNILKLKENSTALLIVNLKKGKNRKQKK